MTIAVDVDWDKVDGLVPAIVQDADGGAVLMLGYMNQDALDATLESQRVTFWSRSRQCLWTKGESSGHFLRLRSIAVDCDGDSLLVLAAPDGPTCHTGTSTCWGAEPPQAAIGRLAFLNLLERVVAERMSAPPPRSYTARLLAEGMPRIAQKVGEEALELALAAVVQGDAQVVGEAADLLYHVILLLRARNLSLAEVVAELESRHAQRTAASSASPDP